MPNEDEMPWRPLSPQGVAEVFEGAPFPWWIAGGYAIERFIGGVLRHHHDIDVLALHRDHAALCRHLSGWECWAIDPPGRLRRWPPGEGLQDEVHDIWCRRGDRDAWSFQVMLDQSEDHEWRSRRCPGVRRPIRELGSPDAGGVPYLAVEIQLFYKAKAPRARDTLDFNASLPLLGEQQRAWLRQAIEAAYGCGNPWLEVLRGR